MRFKKIILLLMAIIMSLTLFGCDLGEPVTGSVPESAQSETGQLIVHFLDVGQGDSTFLELPNGETMLIDAGESSQGDKVVTYIFTQGYDTIDYLVATHPHSDHIGGMDDVINNFNIGNFYTTDVESSANEKILNSVESAHAATNIVTAGDTIINERDLAIEAVAPQTTEADDLNNASIVLKITYKDVSFLFTGDAEKYEEDSIRTNIKCDVLKVGHHGSPTSTSDNFLKKVEPRYAVISCGLYNSYGHPAEKTLRALSKRNIQTFRTDMQGTIIFTSDGKTITVDKDPVEYKQTAPETSNPESHEESSDYSESAAKYVLNTSTKKIHYSDCESVKKTKEENKDFTDDYQSAIEQGYTPCQICKPT